VDIDKERGVILEEIMMYRDQPHHLVQDYLGELMWTNHPVGRPLIGTPDNITRMTRDELLDFKSRKYTTANTLVAFAGQVDHQACVAQAERMMSDFKSRKGPSCKAVDDQVQQRPVHLHRKEVEQTHLAMGFRVFGRHDRRRMTLKLLSVMLGENMSSRLFQVVREKHGLAYSVHSGIHLFTETGGLIISAGLDRAKTAKAMQLIVDELLRLMEKPVSASELQRAKDYAMGQMEIGLESTINQMMWVGENTLSYQRVVQPEELIQQIRAITTAEIQELAQTIFKPNRCSAALVAPMDIPVNEDQISAMLRRLA
jgi:predicted Zn-dependent peptidase